MRDYREIACRTVDELPLETETELGKGVCKEVKGRMSLMRRERAGWADVIRSGKRTATEQEVARMPYFLMKKGRKQKKTQLVKQ